MKTPTGVLTDFSKVLEKMFVKSVLGHLSLGLLCLFSVLPK